MLPQRVFPPLSCAATYITATEEGAACPSGYVPVSDEAECKGAATTALKADHADRAHWKFGSTGDLHGVVGGCSAGSGFYTVGNATDRVRGNGWVQFNTRDVNYGYRRRGYRICRFSPGTSCFDLCLTLHLCVSVRAAQPCARGDLCGTHPRRRHVLHLPFDTPRASLHGHTRSATASCARRQGRRLRLQYT